MSLEDKIKEQYKKREQKSHLYDSSLSYVVFTEKERNDKIKTYLDSYFKNRSRDSLKVLEIGAGHGNNFKAFTEAGIPLNNIWFNELLPERIQHLKNRFPDNKILEGDIAGIEINQKFDVVFQSTVFSSILDRGAKQKIATKMMDSLSDGGIVLWYDFIFNNPRNKDVRKIDVKELKELFPLCGIDYCKITLAPPIGRRVGKWYPVFNLPFLRSHILAVIKK